MLFDSLQYQASQKIDCDICIVGSGAAGISMARRLISSPFQVALIESGDFRRDKRTQNLYDGMTAIHFEPRAEAPLSYSKYLQFSRLRYFGGATNHWGGVCRPLDEYDFRSRYWVPNSGWPISRQVLHNYYKEASGVLRINAFDMNEASSITLPNDYHQILNNTDLVFTNFYRFSRPPVRFGREYREELIRAPNIDIYLNANVSRVKLNESGETVAGVLFSTYSGVEHSVRAKYYILATGGIENARLLLLSDDIQQTGIGNEHDNVGRYFMEHTIYKNTGHCMIYERSDLFDWHKLHEKDGRIFEPAICPTPKAQEQYKMLNAAVNLRRYGDHEVKKEFRRYFRLFSSFDSTRRASVHNREDLSAYRISVKSELEPRRDSRVFLVNDVDELGLRKVRLSYVVSELNLKTIENCFILLGSELARLSKGRVEIFFDPIDAEKSHQFGYHHMGTTRMGSDPKTSVVDKNCKVHRVANLYIAGSSVFPTSGYAPPTLTIVALALRLSEHLLEKLNYNG